MIGVNSLHSAGRLRSRSLCSVRYGRDFRMMDPFRYPRTPRSRSLKPLVFPDLLGKAQDGQKHPQFRKRKRVCCPPALVSSACLTCVVYAGSYIYSVYNVHLCMYVCVCYLYLFFFPQRFVKTYNCYLLTKDFHYFLKTFIVKFDVIEHYLVIPCLIVTLNISFLTDSIFSTRLKLGRQKKPSLSSTINHKPLCSWKRPMVENLLNVTKHWHSGLRKYLINNHLLH